MTKIHPTALVADGAILGEGTEVGPHAIIEDGAVLGADCRVQANAVITGSVRMGDRNFIGHGAIIGTAPQDFAHTDSIQSEVRIGHGNTFREYVTIHRGTKEGTATSVGDKNYLMVGSHMGHNSSVGNNVVMANDVLLAGYVSVGDGAVLGGGSVYHQFVRIGSLVMMRGNTAWGKDVPPFVMGMLNNSIAGLNVVGLRRNGFDARSRSDLKEAFVLIFNRGLNVSQALEKANEREWSAGAQAFLDFIRVRSKRGLVRSTKAGAEPEL